MANKFKPELADTVAETLLIPLCMRAKLTKQNSPIIKDNSAVTLVEQLDYDFAQFQQADMSLIGCGVRANYFDEYACQKVKEATAKKPLMIVSIGCGLDDRYQRVAEPVGFDTIGAPYIHFFEIDLPEVITLRESLQQKSLLPTFNNQTNIAGSLLENDWITTVLEKIEQLEPLQGLIVDFCFMIEGVLMYFEEADVKHFFENLASTLSQYVSKTYTIGDADLIFDAISPLAVRLADKHDTVGKVEATFKWPLQNDAIVSQWDKRYQLQSTTDILGLHPKLWPFKARLLRFIPALLKSSKILTYRLAL